MDRKELNASFTRLTPKVKSSKKIFVFKLDFNVQNLSEDDGNLDGDSLQFPEVSYGG